MFEFDAWVWCLSLMLEFDAWVWCTQEKRRLCIGSSARTIYICNIRCIYGMFCREITNYTVIYGVYIRFWPTLAVLCWIRMSLWTKISPWEATALSSSVSIIWALRAPVMEEEAARAQSVFLGILPLHICFVCHYVFHQGGGGSSSSECFPWKTTPLFYFVCFVPHQGGGGRSSTKCFLF